MGDTQEHARISFELNKAETRKEVIGLALGAASTCWKGGTGDREFDSVEAKLILEDTVARLEQLDQPYLGLATTQDLINELYARLGTFQRTLTAEYQKFLEYRTVDHQ
jgi:hypothetical protein